MKTRRAKDNETSLKEGRGTEIENYSAFHRCTLSFA